MELTPQPLRPSKVNPRRHIMVDIETLGMGRDAAIATIGACDFDIEGNIVKTFYATVDLENSRHPGVLNASTIYWWLKQEKAAQMAMVPGHDFDPIDPPLDLGNALRNFASFLRGEYVDDKVEGFWSNGPTFDEMILRDAYARYEMDFPVSFRASRCCRTIFAQRPQAMDTLPREGVHHNALDDAIYQARGVADILRARELPLR